MCLCLDLPGLGVFTPDTTLFALTSPVECHTSDLCLTSFRRYHSASTGPSPRDPAATCPGTVLSCIGALKVQEVPQTLSTYLLWTSIILRGYSLTCGVPSLLDSGGCH
jgi:hypothetical protein